MTAAIAYEPLDPATIADPFTVYAALRKTGPVHWHDQMKSWVFPRYDDCLSILRNSDDFARDVRRVDLELPPSRQTIQSVDPPENKVLRARFVRAFKDQDLEAIARRLRSRLDVIIAALPAGEPFDYVENVARPLALEASSAILGVPLPDGRLVAELSAAIARRMDSTLDETRRESGNEARLELNAMIKSWLARDTADGVLAAFAGSGEDDHYITNTLAVVFNASYSTVFASLGTTLDVLLDAPPPGLREALASDGDRAADELVRFAGPTQGTSRMATRDVTIHGQRINRGDTVLALVGSANRDEEFFKDADALDLLRSPNRHLGFGWGAHSCFGAPLGKIAIAVAHLGLLFADAPLRRAGATVWKSSATLRTAERIPVTATRARGRHPSMPFA